MFTGIVEGVGILQNSIVKPKKGATSLMRLKPPHFLKQLKIGSSLAVNGVCLTVIGKANDVILFRMVLETIRRSMLGHLQAGDRVNLERPLKASSRIEGHFVLGHVDGVGTLLKIEHRKKNSSFLIHYPKNLDDYILEKGSIAIDGVSLTVGEVGRGAFWVHVIPHTLKVTNFSGYRPGTRVNLEADILMKLAAKLFRKS